MASSGRETGRCSFVNGSEFLDLARRHVQSCGVAGSGGLDTPALAKAITGERRNLAVIVDDRRKTRPAVMSGTLPGLCPSSARATSWLTALGLRDRRPLASGTTPGRNPCDDATVSMTPCKRGRLSSLRLCLRLGLFDRFQAVFDKTWLVPDIEVTS